MDDVNGSFWAGWLSQSHSMTGGDQAEGVEKKNLLSSAAKEKNKVLVMEDMDKEKGYSYF